MTFRGYFDVPGKDRSGLETQVAAQRARVQDRLRTVHRVIAVMSGKGGVGKSHVTAGLAGAYARRFPNAVGVLDADLRSPTVARLLSARGPLVSVSDGIRPARGQGGVAVVSTDLLLEAGAPLRWREPATDQFVWRGVLEAGMLREFLSDIEWGQLAVLLVDLPPGADGATDLGALVPDLAGVVVVTIPSLEAERSVARTMRSARESGLRLLGVVENMSGYRCPGCGDASPLFPGSAGHTLAAEFAVPLLGRLPFDPEPAADAAAAFTELADRLLEAIP